jgi:hypothetical protein
LGTGDEALLARLIQFKEDMAKEVEAKHEALQIQVEDMLKNSTGETE